MSHRHGPAQEGADAAGACQAVTISVGDTFKRDLFGPGRLLSGGCGLFGRLSRDVPQVGLIAVRLTQRLVEFRLYLPGSSVLDDAFSLVSGAFHVFSIHRELLLRDWMCRSDTS